MIDSIQRMDWNSQLGKIRRVSLEKSCMMSYEPECFSVSSGLRAQTNLNEETDATASSRLFGVTGALRMQHYLAMVKELVYMKNAQKLN